VAAQTGSLSEPGFRRRMLDLVRSGLGVTDSNFRRFSWFDAPIFFFVKHYTTKILVANQRFYSQPSRRRFFHRSR
jgi:hypothetical protein